MPVSFHRALHFCQHLQCSSESISPTVLLVTAAGTNTPDDCMWGEPTLASTGEPQPDLQVDQLQSVTAVPKS